MDDNITKNGKCVFRVSPHVKSARAFILKSVCSIDHIYCELEAGSVKMALQEHSEANSLMVHTYQPGYLIRGAERLIQSGTEHEVKIRDSLTYSPYLHD